MTVIKEQRHLLSYINESDCFGINVPTLHLDSALRDDFHTYQRRRMYRWQCNWGTYDGIRQWGMGRRLPFTPKRLLRAAAFTRRLSQAASHHQRVPGTP